MGKIVKYCAACDESFAEKFGFCPNCGQAMTAFEMNPLTQQHVVSETAKAEAVVEEPAVQIPAPILFETAPKIERSPVVETVAVAAANETHTFSDEVKAEDVADVMTEDAPTAPKTFAAAAGANGNGNYYQTATDDFRAAPATPADDDFRVTVIEDKNSTQRNGLLLGSLALMLMLVTGGTVYSLFNKDLGVGAIEDGNLFSYVTVDGEPMELEKPEPEKEGEEGGGGGGGGRKDPEPISKGELPPQFKNKPLLTPSKEDISVSNPAMAVQRGTQGPQDLAPKNRSATNGDPNSSNLKPSNGLGPDDLGMGKDGTAGIGNRGKFGVGEDGDGGIGTVPGNNYGDDPDGGPNGRKPATPKAPPTLPAKPPAVTQKYKIIAKPRADYTNEARQNQVTGTVRVKVQFLSSGQIGSVVPVNGLPYGLTEKAIAAAKAIKFEPAKVDGVPRTTTATVEYNFNIY